MKAIILCAGKGERLKPLTDKIPKPMMPINNMPLLQYNILLCKTHGINKIAINTSYLADKIKEYFGDGKKWGVELIYSFEKELLGTAGALNNFKNFLDETFCVIYGDNITDINLSEMLHYHKSKNSIATLALREKPWDYKTQSLILADENLKIREFLEKPSQELVNTLSGQYKLINSGIYILEPDILNYISGLHSDFGYNIFPKLTKGNNNIYGFIMDKYYFREIGNLEKYNLAKEDIESGKIKLNFLKNKERAIFLDRDGVLNEILYEDDGKLISPCNLSQLKIIKGVKEGINEMRKLGFKIIGVTNQPGISFGYLKKERLDEINNYLKNELHMEEIYYCPHHPKYTGDCNCRKPKVGMIEQAKKDFNLDIQSSYMVGDNLSDVMTGKNAKVKKTFRVGAPREEIIELQYKRDIFPDFTLPDLMAVAEKIK